MSNLTRLAGNHTLKFGIDIRRAYNLRVPSDCAPVRRAHLQRAGHVGPERRRPRARHLPPRQRDAACERYVSTSTDARERQWRQFYYVQDTWRATPKLTLNYGLRADIINPQTVNEAGNGGWLDINTGEIRVGGVGDIDLAGNVKNKINWAPRLGATYQINAKTVIRAGYGRSYDIGVFGSTFGHTVTQNLPVLAVPGAERRRTTSRACSTSPRGRPRPSSRPSPATGASGCRTASSPACCPTSRTSRTWTPTTSPSSAS